MDVTGNDALAKAPLDIFPEPKIGIPVSRACKWCGYRLRVVFINGKPRFYECVRCNAWGLLDGTLIAEVQHLLPPPAEGSELSVEVFGRTGNRYIVSYRIDGGRRTATGCTCIAGQKHIKCRHQKSVEDNNHLGRG